MCQVCQAIPRGLGTSPHADHKRLLSLLCMAAEPAGSISKPSFRASTGGCPHPASLYHPSWLSLIPMPGRPGPWLAPGTASLGLHGASQTMGRDPGKALPGLFSTDAEQPVLTSGSRGFIFQTIGKYPRARGSSLSAQHEQKISVLRKMEPVLWQGPLFLAVPCLDG